MIPFHTDSDVVSGVIASGKELIMEDRWLSVDEISVYRVVTKLRSINGCLSWSFKFLDSW
jgi:hypothetical protein